ncbi:MAG: hypothetical protein WDN00_06860 [Limisphaerales bacterium]
MSTPPILTPMVLGERGHAEFIFAEARVHLHQLFQVLEQHIDADAPAHSGGLFPQNIKIAPGDFDTVPGLARDDVQAAFDKFKAFPFQPCAVVDPLVQHLHKTVDHRERAVDVMNDARVNVAALFGDLFLDALGLQVGKQLLHFFCAAVHFAFHRATLHRLTDGGADGREIKRLVDVVARPQLQRLPDCVCGLKGRHHDHLDVRLAQT